MKRLLLRNKNVILELLEQGKIDELYLLKNLSLNTKSQKILKLAKQQGVKIVYKMSISQMPTRRSGKTKEVIYAIAHAKEYSFDSLLDHVYTLDALPFFLILNKVDIDLNIAVLLRLAYASGVNGIFIDDNTDKIFTDEIAHISSGALLKLPIVSMNIFDAISKIQKEQIPIIAFDMAKRSVFQEDLTGPVAFVFGAEKDGLSDAVLDKADKVLSLPMRKDAESLNVASSASAAIYCKLYQEAQSAKSFNSVDLL